jgi:uncharacterized protein (DUF885 family)
MLFLVGKIPDTPWQCKGFAAHCQLAATSKPSLTATADLPYSLVHIMNTASTGQFIRIRYLLLGLSWITLAACTTTSATPPAAAARQLDAVFEDYFEAYLELFPTFASEIGDHRYDDRLENAISAEHLAAQKALADRTLARLEQVDATLLDTERQLSLSVLAYNLKDTLEAFKFPQQLLPVRQLASFAVEFPLLGESGIHPFKSAGDYDNFVKRMQAFTAWIDSAIANLRRGIAAGVVQPRAVIERTLPQLDAMIVGDAKSSLFYRPIERFPQSFSAAERERLTGAFVDAIERSLLPGYRRLANFLREEYLPKTRDSHGWSELPEGNAWYDYLVRNQTTTDLTPEGIFALGEKEIARIKSEMERLRRASGFNGTLNEFAGALSEKAPRGYSSRAGLIGGYEGIRRKLEPNLAKLFGTIPKSPFEVRTIEEYREQSAPSQYWSAPPDGSRPGVFYVNARAIETNPRRASEALFLHEAIPGHHFQISRQREQTDLPRFQRFADYTAFTEGWALYAESLGAELGLYQEADQNFSRLNSELFRAVRLVVDVGLHRKNWRREQAIKFIIDSTGGGESGASLEVDRYIALPAQALGYKIGQLKIIAIRAKAQAALGGKFAIREFHDELLKDGALPLTILEAKMDRWIERRLR